jgi:hypothetical protein
MWARRHSMVTRSDALLTRIARTAFLAKGHDLMRVGTVCANTAGRQSCSEPRSLLRHIRAALSMPIATPDGGAEAIGLQWASGANATPAATRRELP